MARTEIKFDITKLTLTEYRSLFDHKQPKEEEDEIISRVMGISIDEYLKLNMEEYKRHTAEFFRILREPLESDEKN